MIAGLGSLTQSREMRLATIVAKGAHLPTNSSHSGTSAEWAQSFARSFTDVKEAFIVRETSLQQGDRLSFSYCNAGFERRAIAIDGG
jgi:hypothetical protein